MENSIQNYDLTDNDVKTLIQAGIVPDGTPKSQIAVFARICKEKGLSPFSKEIYLVGYANKYSCITGIDGFRKIAAESGQHAGTENILFDLKSDGTYKTAADLKEENKMPISATCTVYRIINGARVPFTHTAVFKEFSTGQQKWGSMPFQMIGKVAEAFALRKGFADRLTGIFVEEERGAIEGIKEVVVLPELTPDHVKWYDAMTAVQQGRATIEAIRKKYSLSDENAEKLQNDAI